MFQDAFRGWFAKSIRAFSGDGNRYKRVKAFMFEIIIMAAFVFAAGYNVGMKWHGMSVPIVMTSTGAYFAWCAILVLLVAWFPHKEKAIVCVYILSFLGNIGITISDCLDAYPEKSAFDVNVIIPLGIRIAIVTSLALYPSIGLQNESRL